MHPKYFARNLLLIFFLLFSHVLYAQIGDYIFKISNKKNEAIPYATLQLINRADTGQVIKKIADSFGMVTISLVVGNQYSIKISAVNYKLLEKGILLTAKQNNFSFSLESISGNMQEVVIAAKKPLMRQEEDKTIVDPESIAASTTSAYEILERVPGLFVDQDGNVYISSTTPATILINGREIKMSAADIATMLKSLPPGSVAKLEIVSTPSAKYDASGGGGVVNVVLKKGVKIGLTGSINAGLNQGKYGNQFIGFNLTNNNGKINTYLNTQFSLRNNYEQIKTDRKFSADSLLAQDARTLFPGHSFYLGYGIGYEAGKKWELNYDGRISVNSNKNASVNQSIINQISTAVILVNSTADVNNENKSPGINQSVNVKYKIDSAGSEWVTDISYNYNKNNTDQLFATAYTVPLTIAVEGDGSFNNSRHFFVAQSDIKLKLKKQFVVEAGLKSSFVKFSSIADFYKTFNNSRQQDYDRTNTFNYKEHINAAYVQGTKTFHKVILKMGLRIENTNMNGQQFVPADTSFSIHRTDAFPYVYLSRDLFKIAGYPLRAYLVYRRTISRPGYDLLNPFSKFVDQYLSETGNPALRPQFTHNYEANVSFEEKPVLAIGFNDTKDIFTNVIYQSDTNRSKAFRTYDNLGSNKEIYARVLGALPTGGKYFFVAGVQYNHNFYQGIYENAPLSFKRGSWSVFTYQTLKLDKLSSVSINGFVRFNGQQQFYELGTFGSLNANINRQFLNKKLTLTLNVTDMFFTNNNDFFIQQGSLSASGFRKGDTRRFGINIRYNFGFRKKEETNNIFNTESPDK